MLKAEVIETLFYVYVTWTLSAKHFARVRAPGPPASLWLPAPTTYQPRHPLESKCPQEDTMRERPFINGGFYLRGSWRGKTRANYPAGWVMFATMTGGEGPRPRGQSKTWHKCLVDEFTVFRATERSTEHSPLVFGVETARWPVTAKKADKCYRGVLEEAERFMVRWQEKEAKLNRNRHASVVGGVQGKGEGRGKSRTETVVDKSRKEAADR